MNVIFFHYFQVAVRELTPVDDTVERTGLKASIKAAHKAHKAGLKASLKAKIAAHKAEKKGYTPVDDTVERTGLKASIKAKAEAHKAHKASLKASIKAKAAAHKAHKAGLKASIKAKAAAHKAQKKGNLNFNILSELNFAIWKTSFQCILVDYGYILSDGHCAKMSMINVCRKVAVWEYTPVVNPVENTSLMASLNRSSRRKRGMASMARIGYPKFGYPRVIPGPEPNFGYGLGCFCV